MKFNEIANRILSIKEGESLDQWHNAQMDKEEQDPLDDPMFQRALDILEDLKARSPEKYEKFITRLMDLSDYREDSSL